MIGCDCPVCRSADPRNKRNRCAACVRMTAGETILIDTPPELRLACVAAGISRTDAVLLTHSHADHVAGFDDLRRFNELSGRPMPVYGNRETVEDIRARWDYIFNPHTQIGGGKPQVELIPVDGPFSLLGLEVVPVPAWHGRLPVMGYRIGSFAYLTDCSALPESSRSRLRGLEVFVLGAIRRRPHETHFNLAQALEVIADLRPGRAFLTHLTHDLEYEETNRALPAGVKLAYDGLELACG